ncbi:ParB/RepB/Spo0J family partition protein [Actinomadura sp. 9N215]|uniref:ParB/RepB/Spo0J family partition protein n=1 Tax=Actinomadura sp. 9N215 TaxID=3375150 RepID=UPI0037B435EB
MSKADELGVSSSFAAAARPRSERRQMIANATGEAPETDPAGPPRTVAVADLAHNPFNPRTDLGDLQETADSLLEKGQIQPLTIITRQAFLDAHPDRAAALGAASFVVLDGNRRLAAARLAGVDELRVDVNDSLASSAADMLESALVANLHREDLTPLEEAETLAELVKVYGSQRQVARRIGKSHVWVHQRLTLLNLKPELRDELKAGNLTVEDARTIGKLPQEEQTEASRTAKASRSARVPRPRGKAATATKVSEPQIEAQGGNGVNTPAGEPAVDWDDPAALAKVLRERLTAEQRRVLADLLLDG